MVDCETDQMVDLFHDLLLYEEELREEMVDDEMMVDCDCEMMVRW